MKALFWISLFLISNLSFSQSKSKSESRDYVFDSEVYNKERTISVFTPESYDASDSNGKLNVAYLFDGQFQPYFSMVSSIMSYYEQTNEGIPLIVVAIHTQNRWGEFGPVCDGEKTKNPEGADKLTQFLKSEVIPLIDSNYHTTDFKIGIGHSLGGTYVINEIVKEQSIFDAVIAVSPNLTVCGEQIIKNAQGYFSNHPDNRRFIYTSAGTSGGMENAFRESLLHLDSISSKMMLKNMVWNCDILEGQNHMTTFVPSLNTGYLRLSAKLTLLEDQLVRMAEDSALSMSDQIINFYNELNLFSREEHSLNAEKVVGYARTLSQYRKYEASGNLYQYAKALLEDEDVSKKQRKKLDKTITAGLERAKFNAIAQEADKLARTGDFMNASTMYIKAFDMKLIRATHIVRMDAVPVFAQAGKIDEAFEQLELLADRFKLGGNDSFINDPLCTPLHQDKRWKEVMDKLAENGKLYR